MTGFIRSHKPDFPHSIHGSGIFFRWQVLFCFCCRFHSRAGHRNCSVQIIFAVRIRHKKCFKGRGCQVDPLFQHGQEPRLELLSITCAGVFIVKNRFIVKEETKHGSRLMDLYRHTSFCCRIQPAVEQPLCLFFQYFIEIGNSPDHLKRFQSRSYRQGIS